MMSQRLGIEGFSPRTVDYGDTSVEFWTARDLTSRTYREVYKLRDALFASRSSLVVGHGLVESGMKYG
jgi:hypothetical protein